MDHRSRALLLPSACPLLAAVVLASVSLAASAQQSWPSKPVRVIVPYPPGDTADTIVRLISQKITERLGQPLLVDNRAGASGQLGLELAARAIPDGYTVAVGQAGNVAVAPHTYRKLGYDPQRDFTPVALVAMNYLALVVQPSAPYRTVAEMVAWAKANPGKLSFGSNGEGGFPHLSFELLRVQAGFSYLHVPYKGAAQIVNDLLGGQVDAAMASYTSMLPFARAGKLRMLAITNPVRMASAPDVATVADALPGYASQGWFGFLAPSGTPRAVVLRLNEEINRAVRQPDVAERMTVAGLEIIAEPPEAFASLIRRELDKYAKLTRAIGFKPM
ncbi:MAG: Bug family tripartite tricarboxylate transporter substrate binding protein [bacterium]|nr:tripartite tricarboxylate transporter substrate binding protein [Betaproteobacteria bacterium]